MSTSYIIACIPAYNEERNIASVIVRTIKYVDRVLVCDDGSDDLTSQIAEGLGATVISHEKNLGYGATIQTLFSNAVKMGADIVITLDSDNQHNPEEIPDLIQTLVEGKHDIVIGSRFLGNESSIPEYRKNGIKFINRLANVTNKNVSDTQSGFRAYKVDALKSLSLMEDGMGISTEILIKADQKGLSIGEVSTSVNYHSESSKMNPIFHGFSVVIATIRHLSTRNPTVFYGVPGLLSITFSMFFWWILVKKYLATKIFISNVALIAIALTLIGLMLLTTTIIIDVLLNILSDRYQKHQ